MTMHWPRLLRRPVTASTDPGADPEIEAIIGCLRLVGPLTPAARERVIKYIAERAEEMRAYQFEE